MPFLSCPGLFCQAQMISEMPKGFISTPFASSDSASAIKILLQPLWEGTLRSVFELMSLVHLLSLSRFPPMPHIPLSCRGQAERRLRVAWCLVRARSPAHKKRGLAAPCQPGLGSPHCAWALCLRFPHEFLFFFFFPSQSQKLIVAPSCLTALSPPLFFCPTSFFGSVFPLF